MKEWYVSMQSKAASRQTQSVLYQLSLTRPRQSKKVNSTFMIANNFSRQQFLQNSTALFGSLLLSSFTGKSDDEKALVEHEIRVMEDMADNAYASMWKYLTGITQNE